MPDGTVLLWAFCACDTGDVLRSVGLRMADLFPKGGADLGRERRTFDAEHVLHALAHEIIVTLLIAHDMEVSGRGDREQTERLHCAGVRLGNALALIGEGPVPEEIKRIRRQAAA